VFGALHGALHGALFGDAAVAGVAPPAPTPRAANATSSALRLGDLALSWFGGTADLSLVDSDLASDTGLTTAVLLSIFVDRRAAVDDKPPSGDPDDRRGWWADQFSEQPGDKIGSRLWLLDRAKRTGETARKAEEYVREALDWMISDRVVESVDVEIEMTSTAILIGVGLNRPGKDRVALKFSHVWT
jgi:phage gp46-like protein